MKIYPMVAIIGVTFAAGQAEANCSDRIDAALDHPAIVSDTAVKDDGKVTKYQDGGPATPRENWFGSKPELSAVLAHLDAAKEALNKGDMPTCNVKMDQVEAILEKTSDSS